MLVTFIVAVTKIPDRKQLKKKEDLFWITVYKYVVHHGGEGTVMAAYTTKITRRLQAQGVAWGETPDPLASYLLPLARPRLLMVAQHPEQHQQLGTEGAKPRARGGTFTHK